MKNSQKKATALFIDLRLIYEVDGLKDNGDQACPIVLPLGARC